MPLDNSGTLVSFHLALRAKGLSRLALLSSTEVLDLMNDGHGTWVLRPFPAPRSAQFAEEDRHSWTVCFLDFVSREERARRSAFLSFPTRDGGWLDLSEARREFSVLDL